MSFNFSFSLFQPLFLFPSVFWYFSSSPPLLFLSLSLSFSPHTAPPSPSDRPASRPCLPAASPCPDASTLCPWSDPDVRQGLAGSHGPLPGRQREGTPSRSPLWWLPAQPCGSSGLQFSRPGLSWLKRGRHSVAAWLASPRCMQVTHLLLLPTRDSSCLIPEGRRYRPGTRSGAEF